MSGVSPEDSTVRGSTFRADIEGLRAVAVVLVLLYHAGVPGFVGGFVGVDVFFVISGFLITGLIVREIGETGRISLTSFYARRARRLLPAAFVVVLVTVAASALVLPPLRVPDVAADGAAAALYVSNVRFAAQATDYLQAELDPSPLLHFWSLGVEEQFYLFWPALLLVVSRFIRRPAFLAAVVAAVAAVSFGLSLWLTDANAPLAFFLLPPRAWELALGGLVFLGAGRLAGLPRSIAAVAGLVGLAAIVAASILIDGSMPFPGLVAILPTAGAALVIAAGVRQPLRGPSLVLASGPARWIGRISYSLYLWHWPILVLPAAALGEELPPPARIGLALAAVPIAALSQRFVEDPFRRGRLIGSVPRRSLVLAGAASVVVAAGSLGIGRLGGLPGGVASAGGDDIPPLILPGRGESAEPSEAPGASPSGAAGSVSPGPGGGANLPPTPGGPVPADLIPPLAEVRSDIPPIHADGCHAAVPDVTVGECAFGDVGSRTSVVLTGDSHAAQWFPALEWLAEKRGWRLISLTKGSCPFVDIPVWSPSQKRPFTECDAWRTEVVERIKEERPAMIIVSNSRIARLIVSPTEVVISQEHDEIWGPALRRMLRRIQPMTGALVVIGDTPNPKTDPPVCLSANLDDALACATPAARSLGPERTRSEGRVVRRIGGTYVDPTGWICPSDPCPVVIDRWIVYRDGGHIATAFARALGPYLERKLPELP